LDAVAGQASNGVTDIRVLSLDVIQDALVTPHHGGLDPTASISDNRRETS
jgi:hypothetical protein